MTIFALVALGLGILLAAHAVWWMRRATIKDKAMVVAELFAGIFAGALGGWLLMIGGG